MNDPLEYLARHGSVVLFLAVLAEQLGIPLPSAPVILAAGVLIGRERMSWTVALAAILVAALLADSLWYALGKRYGRRVLRFLCRASLQPDSCVRNTQNGFARHGAWLVVGAKFVPGLNTVTPPLAAMVGIGIPRFLALDSLGIIVQSLLLLGAGVAFRGPFGRFAHWLTESAARTPLLLGGALLAYVAWKYARRWRALRELRMTRVTPAELKAKLDAGEPVFIVDLRHPFEQAAGTLPGALRIQIDELATRHQEVPRDREVILFCT